MKKPIKKDRKAVHNEMWAYLIEHNEIKDELIKFGMLISDLCAMEHKEMTEELKNMKRKRIK